MTHALIVMAASQATLQTPLVNQRVSRVRSGLIKTRVANPLAQAVQQALKPCDYN